MRVHGRTRADHGDGFDDSPYSCPWCLGGIDPATTTIESATIRGACADCGRAIDFVDRSGSAELAERWTIDRRS